MNLEQVRALAAIGETGSFELAARRLHLTPSAVSQRVKALETSTGQVVVRRGSPCTLTEAGAVLVRFARQVELLEAESQELLGVTRAAPAEIPVAVNADSLDTWFAPVLREASGWADTRLSLVIRDEDHTLDVLRHGEVVAAITSSADAVPGCRQVLLGAIRYVAVANPGLARRFSRGGEVDWENLPVLRYDSRDDLQESYLAARGLSSTLPPSTVPSASGLRSAAVAGLGWILVPEVSVTAELADGRLVCLSDETVEIPLYWHAWKAPSHRLARLTDAVVAAAAAALRPVHAGRDGALRVATRPLARSPRGM
ncbi:ArgP/LysG family DNA-binding transcriptional regulator [Knoellia sp. CPCC 206435]|uniref:ArgP/LysG family DNA-binding transcriptional regulator n=1 Tax=Knoellia terrae TaxID=3404797 RepID=UPI003B434DC4